MREFECAKEVGHYGIADFLIDRVTALRNRVCGDPVVPTLIHITHAKAGSTWMAHLLSRLFGSRCAPRGENAAAGSKLEDHVFESGRVYSAMFLTREEVAAHPELQNVARFVVIRDLRDTLVSLYFSLKVSHPTGHRKLESTRATLQHLPEEEGLLQLIENKLDRIARLQGSWIGSEDLVLRYEDLITDPYGVLEKALIERLRLPVSAAALTRAIRRTHFQQVFKRKLGEERVESHGRKGLPGDWQTRFTPAICRRFEEKFGDVLRNTGYETDDRWVTNG